jgi:spore maturation protein CgeB
LAPALGCRSKVRTVGTAIPGMRFVIVNHAYDDFLGWLYGSKPGLERQSFKTQMAIYYATLFASSDFYVHALRSLNHEVEEFVVNNLRAQEAWLDEHRSSHLGRWLSKIVRLPGGRTKKARAALPLFETLLDQVRLIRPDVIYNQSVYAFDDDQLSALKKYTQILVGEHAAMPLPESINYQLYDLIVSSFPPTLQWLRDRGARAELNRLAFDPRVADMVREGERDIRASFVGSFLPIHRSRLELVEAVASRVDDLTVHGALSIELSKASPLLGKVGHPLWGRDMYAFLRRSQITLNHHGDVPAYANNMRLYEATGMGCLLLTDYKDNLHEMFEPEKEIVTYRDAAECVDKALFYLNDCNRAARDRIAAAGQMRTLSEHTYYARMKRLVELIEAA